MKRKLGINIDCIGGGFDESVTLDIAHQTGFEVFTTSKRPIEMLSAIKEKAVAYAIAEASPEEIDEYNILTASIWSAVGYPLCFAMPYSG